MTTKTDESEHDETMKHSRCLNEREGKEKLKRFHCKRSSPQLGAAKHAGGKAT